MRENSWSMMDLPPHYFLHERSRIRCATPAFSLIRLTMTWIMMILKKAASMLQHMKSVFFAPAFCSPCAGCILWANSILIQAVFLLLLRGSRMSVLWKILKGNNYSRSWSLSDMTWIRSRWWSSKSRMALRVMLIMEHFVSPVITPYDTPAVHLCLTSVFRLFALSDLICLEFSNPALSLMIWLTSWLAAIVICMFVPQSPTQLCCK